MMVKLTNVTALFATLLIVQTSFANTSGIRCIVESSGVNSTDDSPAIIEIFERRSKNGNIVFKNETYFMEYACGWESTVYTMYPQAQGYIYTYKPTSAHSDVRAVYIVEWKSYLLGLKIPLLEESRVLQTQISASLCIAPILVVTIQVANGLE